MENSPPVAGRRPGSASCGRSDKVHGRFVRAWLEDPLRVAAIAPSSPSLARLITCEITASQSPILELGPGTGVFTRALIAQGIRESDITLVELGRHFVDPLRLAFPRARTLYQDAAAIEPDRLFPHARAGAVISGLGLLSMPAATVVRILANAFGCLRPDGAFYQFTYGPRCPVSRAILEDLGLEAVRIGGTFRNLPPASVYRIGRRTPPQVKRPHLQTAAREPDDALDR